jgi:hypothetical protein
VDNMVTNLSHSANLALKAALACYVAASEDCTPAQ